MFPNSAAGFGWTKQSPAYNPLSGPPNTQVRQIGFCLDSATNPAPYVEPVPVNRTPGLFGFDLSNMGPPMEAPPAYPSSPQMVPGAAPAGGHVSPYRPSEIQITLEPSKPSAPSAGINSRPSSSSISTPHRSHSERIVEISPAKKPENKNNKDDDDNGRRRRSSYQEGLKNMAELMTDVQLTDDVLNDLRTRFDLNN